MSGNAERPHFHRDSRKRRRLNKRKSDRAKRSVFEPLEARTLLTGTPLGQVIDAQYQDVLRRPADQFGLTSWSEAIANGTPREQVALSILTSTEDRSQSVTDYYNALLGRNPDPGGLNFWVGKLASGDRLETIEAFLIGSEEYFQKKGGTVPSYVQGVYNDVLKRNAEPGGLSFWSDFVNNNGRTALANTFINTQEFRTQLVTSWYNTYLHRNVDPGGNAFWTGQLASGATQEQIQARLAGSLEYFNSETFAGILTRGVAGQTSTVTVHYGAETAFANELGLFPVDDISGKVGSLKPGDAGYLAAALAQPDKQVIFQRNDPASLDDAHANSLPGSVDLSLQGRHYYGIYLAQDATLADARRLNPDNLLNATPLVFTSIVATNPDHLDHFKYTNYRRFGVEDLTNGGDKDFNDALAQLDFVFTPPPPPPPGDTDAPIVNISSPEEGAAFRQNPTISGNASDVGSGLNKVEARIDGGPFFVVTFDAGGAFSFPTQLPTDGSADGTHLVEVRAMDKAGNSSTIVSRSFVLDTTPPAPPIFDLDPAFDTAPQGDHSTSLDLVTLVGQTDPNVMVTLERLGAVIGTTTSDGNGKFVFTNVALDLGDNLFTTHASDSLGNMRSANRTIVLNQCEFDATLTGWTTTEQGGTDPGQGTVVGVDGRAVLTEGNSFVVELSKQFTVPASPSKLSISFEDLVFDHSSTGRILDAFEAAYIDSQGRSLVPTFALGRDAFFNISDGLPALLGSGATSANGILSVDLSSVPAGSQGKLILRLVNNDADTTTSVKICTAKLETIINTLSATSTFAVGTHGTQSTPGTAASRSSAASTNPNPALANNVMGAGQEGVRSTSILPAPATQGAALLNSQIPAVSLANLPPGALTVDSRGTDFWLGFNANLHEGGQPVVMTLFITGDVATTGVVEIPGLSTPFSAPFAVNPGQVTSIVLPDETEVRTVSTIEHKGIHVTANDEVTVYGLNRELATTDAFLGLPTDSLGQEYVNLTYKNTGRLLSFVAGTQMMVVGTQDNTQVTIDPGQYSPVTPDSFVDFLDDNDISRLQSRNGQESSTFVANPGGDYTLRVKPPAQAYAGTYKYRFIDLESDAIPLVLDTTTTASFATGKETVVYRFQGTAGQNIYVDGQTPSDPNIRLSLISPSNVLLHNSNASNNSSILTLAETGTYFVVLSANTPAASSAQFKVFDLSQPIPALPMGTPVSGTLATGRESFIYELQGTAGQRLYFDSLGSSATATDLVASGNRLLFRTGTSSDFGPTELPETGTYRVVVEGNSNAATQYNFRMIDMATIPTLSLGDTASGSLDVAEVDLYKLDAQFAQKFIYDGRTSTGGPAVRLINPANQQVFGIAANNDSSPQFVDQTGEYLLRLESLFPSASTYEFRLLSLDTASAITDESVQSGALAPFETKVFTVSKAVGAHVMYDGIDADFDNVVAELVDSAGDSQGGFFFNADSDSVNYTMRGVSPYYLFIRNNLSSATDFGFRLLDADAVPTLAFDTEVSGTIPTGRELQIYQFSATTGDRFLFDSLESDGENVSAIVIGPAGEIFRVNESSDSAPFRVFEDGTYRIAIAGQQGGAADFNFRLRKLANVPTLQFGVPTSDTVTPSLATAVYQFDAQPGDLVSFDSQSLGAGVNGTWTIYGPDMVAIRSTVISGDFSVRLSLAGKHVLVLQNTSAAATFSFTFQANVTPEVPVAPGGFDAEQLLSFAAGGSATYQFTAPAGTVVLLDSLDTSIQGISVALLDPNNVVLRAGTDNGDTGITVLPQSGTYTVKVQGFNATQSGDYRFRVLNLSSAPLLSPGDLITDTFDVPLGTRAYRLTTSVGQRLVYSGIDNDIDNVAASFYAPNGAHITTLNADQDSPVPQIRNDGEHFILLSNNQNALPDYSFQTLDFATATPLTLNAATSGVLDPGTKSTLYKFQGTVGQQLYFDGTDNDFDAMSATLYDLHGNQVLAVNADVNSGPFTIAESGQFTLWILGGVNAPADFAFRMLETSTATAISLDTPVTGTVGTLGRETVLYKFAGTAGQRLFYDALDGDFDGIVVQILSPTGRQILNLNADSDGPFFLPETGDYQVLIIGGAAANADFGFKLIDLDNVSPLTLNARVTQSQTSGFLTGAFQFTGSADQVLYYNGLHTGSPNGRFDIYDSNLQFVDGRILAQDGLLTLPRDGQYFVLHRGSNAAAFDLDFNLQDVTNAPLITSGQEVSGTVDPGQAHVVFRFNGAAGERWIYDGLDNIDNDIRAAGFGPSFASQFNVNSDADGGLFSLAESGTHYIVIQGNIVGTAGFRFAMRNVADAPLITLGADTTALLNTGRHMNLFRINSAVPGTLTFHKVSSTTNTPQWTLFGPANQFFASTTINNDMVARKLLNGEYVLKVDGNSSSAAPINYTFHSDLALDPAVPLSGFNVETELTVPIKGEATASFSLPAGRILFLDVLQSQFAIPTHTITLNAGDTYQVRDEIGSNDLTGTIVTSDKPIAVYGSHLATFIPDGSGFADHIVEQLPPTQAWGREFVTMPLATRLKGDTFRFLAGTDGTVVKVNNAVVATLLRGQYFEQIIKNPSQVTANHPILVAQYSNSSEFDGVTSDPFMVIVPPHEQFLANYTVTTPATGFDVNYINVVAPTDAVGSVELDGSVISAASFVAIGTSGFSGAQLAVDKGTHNLAGTLPFGVFVYGFAPFDSYGYTGGQSLSPVARASSLVLAPANATRPIGASQIFKATVLDDLDQPVEGVRVDFLVSGVNPTQGFAFTDANGVAEFTLVGAISGNDVIQATLSNLVDESTITWQGAPAPPSIQILSPAGAPTITAGQNVIVSGVALADIPNSFVSLVTVNGVPVDALDGAGNFFAQVFVAPGLNTFLFAVEDSFGATAVAALNIFGEAQTGDVDFNSLSDVSGSFRVNYAVTSFHEESNTLFADFAIENVGQYSADNPLYVGITNLSDPSVRLLNPAGQTPQGAPYYDFSGLVSGGVLNPAGKTGFLSAAFLNPNQVQFTYDLVFFGKLNDPPVFDTLPKLTALVGKSYTYDANAHDPNADPVKFALLTSPDGMTIDPDSGILSWAPGVNDVGSHDVTIRATDGRGGATDQHYILSAIVPPPNRPPLFTSLPVSNAFVNEAYQYDVNAIDPDDDSIQFSLEVAALGMTIDQATGLISWTPDGSQVGFPAVTVVANDGNGGISRQQFTICVHERPDRTPPIPVDLPITPPPGPNTDPQFTNQIPTTVRANDLLQFTFAASDAQADPLTFDILVGPLGSSIDPSTGDFQWTPLPSDAPQQSLSVRVRDGHGGVDIQSVTLQIGPARTNPLFNDPDMSAFSAVVGSPWRRRFGAQHAESPLLSYSLFTAPPSMTIDPATGVVNWTPAAAELGLNNVVVRVTSPVGGHTDRAFSINVISTSTNHLPTVDSVPRNSISPDNLYVYAPIVRDEDFDPLAFSLDLAPPGMTIDASSGLVTWMPTIAQLGTHDVRIVIDDGHSSPVTQNFSIDVLLESDNQTPAIGSTPPTGRTLVGEIFAYDLKGFDPDNDPVEWRLVSGPSGVSVDPALGTLRWLPREEHLGIHQFVVQVSDPYFASSTQTFSLEVACANLPPRIITNAPTQGAVDSRYLYAVGAIDPERQPLAFSLETAPSGMTIDNKGVIRWTPSSSQQGTQDVVVLVKDSFGAEVRQAYQVDVTNDPVNQAPVFLSRPVFRATIDEPYSYQARAVDPEGSVVQYSLLSPPAGMSIDPDSGAISWTPNSGQAGPHLIKIAADDGTGGRGIQTFALLARANTPPVIISTAVTLVAAGEEYVYDVRATDVDHDALQYELTESPSDDMVIDSFGRITWPTTSADLGTHDVTVKVTDVHGASVLQSYILNVDPDAIAPSVSLSADALRVALGSSIRLFLTADDNVAVVAKTLKINGEFITLDANGTALFAPTAIGTFLAEGSATDAEGNIGTASLSLRVYDPADTAGPTVVIASPADGEVLTEPTPVIGTVDDANLAFFELQYARADQVPFNDPEAEDVDYVTIFHGTTNIANAGLGTFDPTLLENDDYVIRVVAEDLGGNRTVAARFVSVRGDLKLGNFKLSYTDLVVPLAGIPIQVVRNYDTLQARVDGDFGFGWQLGVQSANIRESIPVNPLEEQGLLFAATPFRNGTRVYLTNPEGRRVGFTFSPTASFSLFGGGFFLPRFIPDPGVLDTLEVDPTPMQFVNGGYNIHFLGFPYNPAVYRLKTQDGVVYEYNQFQGLQSITSRTGVVLTFGPDGIASSVGGGISFIRDPQGRIQKVIDPSGSEVRYAYDAQGNLSTVTDQVGSTTTFQYLADPAHFLDSIIDPRGIRSFKAEFDTDGRLIGSENALGAKLVNSFDLATRTETTTDPSGNSYSQTYDEVGNLVKSVDPLGAITQFEYDAAENLTKAVDPAGNEVLMSYDSRGNITQITDPLGQMHHVTYNAFNQVSTVTDAAGRTGTMIYDSQGGLVQYVNAVGDVSGFVLDSLGRETEYHNNAGRIFRYEYGSGKRPIKAIHPDGTFETFTYNQYDQLTRRVDELGRVTEYTYDPLGRPIAAKDPLGNITSYSYQGDQFDRAVDALGRITRFEYDENGRRSKLIDPAGGVIQYVYDANNRVIRTVDPLGNSTQSAYRQDGRVDFVLDKLGNKTQFEYDVVGNTTAVISPLGARTRFEYDELGRVIKQIDPLGGIYEYEYDTAGNYISTTDPNGHQTRFEYDPLNQLVRTIDAAGGVTRRFYDDNGHLIRVQDANGNETRFEYDLRGRMIRSIDAAGAENEFEYDDVNNLTRAIDPLGEITRFEYDSLNRRVKSIDPLGAETSYIYDAIGNVLSSTDPLGRKTTFNVDSLNRLQSLIDPSGATTQYTYDSAGRRTSVQDPLGNQTTFVYDAVGHLTERTDPFGKTETRNYDAEGQLIEFADRNGRVTTYDYDLNGRRTEEKWLDGVTTVNTITYAYDPAGNLLSGQDASSKLAYQYDSLNRITQVDNDQTPGVPRVVMTYEYDAIGNALVIRDDSGTRLDNTFDNRNMLVSRAWQGGGVDPARVDLQYNLRRERIRLDRFSDSNATQPVGHTIYQYDAMGKPTKISHQNALDAVLAEYDYAYDFANQLVGESHHGEDTTYDYDPTGQLLSADRSTLPDETFTYDANGNRVGTDIVLDKNRLLNDGLFSYVYDNEGNLIKKTNLATNARTEYVYDHRNRLINVQDFDDVGNPLTESQFTYDFLDHRIKVDTPTEHLRSVYVGPSAWVDFDENGNVVARYLHGTDIDEPWARFRPGEGTAWYLADRMGTIRDLTDASGAVQDHIEYDAFGAIRTETDPSFGDRFKFTGREFDASTGLYYYRARYLDPKTGRFISEDPLGFLAGDANLQRYVGNGPTNAMDPTGLQGISEWGATNAFSAFYTGVALSYGQDTPFTFRIGRGGISGSVDGPPALNGNFPIPDGNGGLSPWSAGGGTGGPPSIGYQPPWINQPVQFTYTFPDKDNPYGTGGAGIGPINFSTGKPDDENPLPTQPPPYNGEFSFYVVSVAKSPNLVISANLAIYVGVAEQLALIAAVASADDAQTTATVHYEKSTANPKASVKARGFAQFPPRGLPTPSNPPPPPPPTPTPPPPPPTNLPGGGPGDDGGDDGDGDDDGGDDGGDGGGGGFYCGGVLYGRVGLVTPYLRGDYLFDNIYQQTCCSILLNRGFILDRPDCATLDANYLRFVNNCCSLYYV